MKFLYLLPMSVVLTGCAITEWIVNNEKVIDTGADMANGVGPYGAIAGLVMSTALAGAKWYEHKTTTKDLVATVQKAKKDLPPEAKKILADGLDKHMPSKVKKIVRKLKG